METTKENFSFLKSPNVNRLQHRPQLHPSAQEVTGNPDYISPNAQLIGVNTEKVKNNPRLTQQPIYRLNSIYGNSNYSQLNEQGDDYSYESGYITTPSQIPSFERVVSAQPPQSKNVEGYQSHYTNYIDPSTTVYYSPKPINSNIGVSEMPQYDQYYLGYNPPNSVVKEDGTIDISEKLPQQVPSEYNTFDPRSFGYGTSYRYYLDPMTKSGKYFYKDIDNIKRMHGVIGRSNIDHIRSAHSPAVGMNETVAEIHKDYLDKDIARRNDFRDKWMRKYHTQIGWQRKIAPLRKNY